MQKLPPATRVELAIINSTAGRVKLVIEPAYHQPSEPLGSAYAAALGVKADQSPTPKVLTVAEVMQNPKLAEALAKLKECPFMYQELVAHDPELQSLFEQLERAVAAKEAEKQAEKQAPAKKAGAGGVHPATIARMEGGAAFKAGDYARAAARFATAIAHGGKNPQFLHANRSAALSACGRYAEALEAADAAVARDASYYGPGAEQGDRHRRGGGAPDHRERCGRVGCLRMQRCEIACMLGKTKKWTEKSGPLKPQKRTSLLPPPGGGGGGACAESLSLRSGGRDGTRTLRAAQLRGASAAAIGSAD